MQSDITAAVATLQNSLNNLSQLLDASISLSNFLLLFFYTIFLPDGQNITFVWDSMFEDICAAEFVFL